MHAEGNAGNQVKVTGASEITNAVVVGNCAFFEGQPFTYLVDHCRALGNTLALFFTGGEPISLTNVTVYGQGDGLLMGGVREGSTCTGDERLVVRNSVFLGDTDYFDSTDITFLFYQEDCGGLRMDSDYNLLQHVKNVECGVAGDYVISGSSRPVRRARAGRAVLRGRLRHGAGPGSPAIDTGDNSASAPAISSAPPRPQMETATATRLRPGCLRGSTVTFVSHRGSDGRPRGTAPSRGRASLRLAVGSVRFRTRTRRRARHRGPDALPRCRRGDSQGATSMTRHVWVTSALVLSSMACSLFTTGLQGNRSTASTPRESDVDRDGVVDAQDNCPLTANPGQDDGDGNRLGELLRRSFCRRTGLRR